MARKNASFGPDFWKALKRIQAEKATLRGKPRGSWLPTADVWPYREYNRHEDNLGLFGGSPETVNHVETLKASMDKVGQSDPGHLLYDPYVVEKPSEGLYGMHLGEGNHRIAAAKALGNPHYLVALSESQRKPNYEHGTKAYLPDGSRPGGTRRNAIAKKSIRPNEYDYIPSNAHPSDFEEFAGKSIDPVAGKPGSPSDRSIVSSLGHSSAAKRLLSSMKVAGKVLGPVAGAVGLVAGLSDPMEALGATVDKTEGNKWAKKQKTPAMKKSEKKYYSDKRQKAIDSNPIAALLQKQGKLK